MPASPPNSPAGWYDDANDAAVKRYWDGAAWTAHTAPRDATPVEAASRIPAKKPKWLLIGGAALLGVIFISSVANAIGGGDSPDGANSVVEKQPTAEPQPVGTPAPTVEPTTLPAPTVAQPSAPPAVEDVALFASTASGDLDDFVKDLDDMVLTLDEGGFFRLLSNSVELSFNLGQLQAEPAPASIAGEWTAQLAALEGSIDLMDAAISDERNDDLRSTIEVARGQVDGLRALTESIG